MTVLITSIILAGSLIGIGVILFRKIPVLVKLPKTPEGSHEPVILKIKRGAKSLPGLKDFSYELYLQKILSRVRVLTLKTEHKTGSWLEKLRQRSNKKSGQNEDNYWEELKKAKKG